VKGNKRVGMRKTREDVTGRHKRQAGWSWSKEVQRGRKQATASKRQTERRGQKQPAASAAAAHASAAAATEHQNSSITKPSRAEDLHLHHNHRPNVTLERT
jgi:hypothetical protein